MPTRRWGNFERIAAGATKCSLCHRSFSCDFPFTHLSLLSVARSGRWKTLFLRRFLVLLRVLSGMVLSCSEAVVSLLMLSSPTLCSDEDSSKVLYIIRPSTSANIVTLVKFSWFMLLEIFARLWHFSCIIKNYCCSQFLSLSSIFQGP